MNESLLPYAIVAELRKIQQEQGVGHREFAAKLGISHSVWVRICQAYDAGDNESLERQIGKAALRKFRSYVGPDLAPYVDTFIAHEPDSSATIPPVTAVA